MGASTAVPIYHASPPKGVPPLKLPNTDQKKVYISAEVTEDLLLKPAELDTSPVVINKKKPPPPGGVIPLFALGHNPHYDPKAALKRTDSSVQNAVHNYYLGPYGKIFCSIDFSYSTVQDLFVLFECCWVSLFILPVI